MKYLFSVCAVAVLALGIQLGFAEDSSNPASSKGACPLSGKCEKSAEGECASKCSKEGSGECASKCSKECSEGECASKCSQEVAAKCEGGCASGSSACCQTIAAAKKLLPQMTYLVGTEAVCCSEMASELAEKSKEKVQFVVAEKTYCCKEAAFTALVEETEKFVNAFVSPSKCEASGKTTVAGKSYDCCQSAAKQTELVSTAAKAVRMAYKVGDEEVCCVKHASTLAKEKKASINYLVDGEATECELTARLKLATAKYIAAINAIAKAEQVDTTASVEKVATEESGS